jgi:AraC family transcriptional regulator, positive regulator of tynA and feaB
MTKLWEWRPELGRWHREKYGYATSPTLIAVSTNGVPPSSSYDYWRNIAFSDFEADQLAREQTVGFRANARGIACATADFFDSDSGGVSGGRSKANISRDGLDGLSIGLISRGHRWAEDETGKQSTSAPGEFFVYDAQRPSRVKWSDHRATYLVIRREAAQRVLGSEVPDTTTLAQRLARSPMRHLMADQLRQLAKHHETLGTEEQTFLLEQAVQLTLFVLAPRSDSGQPMVDGEALLHTALRYISTNLADPLLDTSRVAAALRVSRATLYRSFAAQNQGVAEAIRDIRLDRARSLLANARPSLSIAEVAMHCGIYDTANFSRQFKRRFGVVPSHMRAATD